MDNTIKCMRVFYALTASAIIFSSCQKSNMNTTADETSVSSTIADFINAKTVR